MWDHRKNTRREHWYIYEKLPFKPHRPEYGKEKIIWETDIIIDHDTTEFDKYNCFDEVLRDKTEQFLVTDIIYEPLFNDGDNFGKWVIKLHKIENGKLTKKYQTRYESRASLSIRFVKKANYKEVSIMKEEYITLIVNSDKK
ncbi:MAG: hypothetical protein WA057_05755 [Candidatus Magasanikiibacteriota bacterium]